MQLNKKKTKALKKSVENNNNQDKAEYDNNENKRSSNKNENDNSNNNDLKDGQNYRLKKKKTLIRTRNCSGLYTFEEYKHYTKNNLKQRPGEKMLKAMGYITPTMGHFPRNGQI